MGRSLKERFEPAMLLVAPAAVLTGWVNDNSLVALLRGQTGPLLIYSHWFPILCVGGKILLLSLSAGILVYAKPYEAYLFTRPQDVTIWRCWKNTMGLVCGLIFFECLIRSQGWFGWMGGAQWSKTEAWFPLHTFLISLIVLGVSKRCMVCLGRMSQ